MDKTEVSLPANYGRMDPLALLEELHDCIKDKAYPEAVLKLAAYYRWRVRGGFEPIRPGQYGNTRGDQIIEKCAAQLADALRSIS